MRGLALLCAVMLSCSAPSGDLPRFYTVDPLKVYRSAQPTEAGYSEMAALGIRTVVKLNSDLSTEEHAWAKAHGITLIEIDLPGLWAPRDEDENRVLAALENPALQPVLVHCQHGQDRTGLSVALYRVAAQGVKPVDAHEEWRRLGHSPLLFGMDRYFERRTGERRDGQD